MKYVKKDLEIKDLPILHSVVLILYKYDLQYDSPLHGNPIMTDLIWKIINVLRRTIYNLERQQKINKLLNEL